MLIIGSRSDSSGSDVQDGNQKLSVIRVAFLALFDLLRDLGALTAVWVPHRSEDDPLEHLLTGFCGCLALVATITHLLLFRIIEGIGVGLPAFRRL